MNLSTPENNKPWDIEKIKGIRIFIFSTTKETNQISWKTRCDLLFSSEKLFTYSQLLN